MYIVKKLTAQYPIWDLGFLGNRANKPKKIYIWSIINIYRLHKIPP